MKSIFTFIAILFTFCLSAQSSFWSDVNMEQISLPRNSEKNWIPTEYRPVSLELTDFVKKVSKSPAEFIHQRGLIISLPMPDGRMENFEIWDSPIMEEGLARKYPSIQTFKGKSISNPLINTRLGYSNLGFHAMIHTPEGAIFIDPLATNQSKYYTVSYAKHAAVDEAIASMKMSCGTKIKPQQEQHISPIKSSPRNQKETVDLFIYRAAIACTGEYADYHNANTKEAILARFTSIMNRANMVFERDAAIRMVMIEETDKLIFLDPDTDPYEAGNNLVSSFAQNPAVIENAVGRDAFDIGHVFIAKCSAGGGAVGLASLGSACQADKASGSSCQFYNDSRFAVELVCHEMGHQLGASHSWGNCPGNEGQISSGTAFEPGSGSTIMSYSGACGSDNNLQSIADDYFHSGNIEQILREKITDNCAEIMPTGNNNPIADFDYENGFFIPINTPFELVGSGTDEEGDGLTYCWEQLNTGPAVTLGSPVLNGPSFRSFSPTTDSNRIIPRVVDLINNRTNKSEVLPTYERNLRFRLTVRDNNVAAGGVDWKDVSFGATEEAGPFLVEFPNKVSDVLNAGTQTEIIWDVAGTNGSKVNCQKVNILLSTNRGITFPHVLVADTDNDGIQAVTIPDVLTTKARIKVEAADNIFFAISKNDISILSPTSVGFSFATSIQTQQVCLPNTIEIDLETFSLLGFDQPITFLGPSSETGAFTTSFSQETVNPGMPNTFSINFPADYPEGEFSFDIKGVATEADTVTRSINLDLVSNQFTDLKLMEPSNNSAGVGLPNFLWTTSVDADLYEIEIATNPAFGDFIIDAGRNIIGNSYTPSLTLDQSTIYYWRVRPVNDCGVGTSSDIFAFQTQNLSCSSQAATEVPLIISSLGTPTIASNMTVTQNFIISDLNIPKIKGSHDWVSHIRTTLVSPAGTEAVLFTNKCPGSVPFNLGFDDESPNEIPCPPIGSALHQPKEALSIFDGESTFGDWMLKIEVLDNFGEGGSLDEWSLEFCGNISLDPPQIVTNEILTVKPATGRLIDPDFLLVEDENNSAAELIYTLVTLPTIGTLLFNREPVVVGAQFTQADINNGNFKYRHDTNATVGSDQFTFTVSDGEGGWIGITPFQIQLDESETTVGIEEVLDENLVNIYPNPAREMVQIDLSQLNTKAALISIFDVQGRQVLQKNVDISGVINIVTNNFEAGLYFVQVKLEEGVLVKKLVIGS